MARAMIQLTEDSLPVRWHKDIAIPIGTKIKGELTGRRQRTTRQLIDLLSAHYGRQLDRKVVLTILWRLRERGQVEYIPMIDETGIVSRWLLPRREEER